MKSYCHSIDFPGNLCRAAFAILATFAFVFRFFVLQVKCVKRDIMESSEHKNSFSIWMLFLFGRSLLYLFVSVFWKHSVAKREIMESLEDKKSVNFCRVLFSSMSYQLLLVCFFLLETRVSKVC